MVNVMMMVLNGWIFYHSYHHCVITLLDLFTYPTPYPWVTAMVVAIMVAQTVVAVINVKNATIVIATAAKNKNQVADAIQAIVRVVVAINL